VALLRYLLRGRRSEALRHKAALHCTPPYTGAAVGRSGASSSSSQKHQQQTIAVGQRRWLPFSKTHSTNHTAAGVVWFVVPLSCIMPHLANFIHNTLFTTVTQYVLHCS
jgi:hypothetical protein